MKPLNCRGFPWKLKFLGKVEENEGLVLGGRKRWWLLLIVAVAVLLEKARV